MAALSLDQKFAALFADRRARERLAALVAAHHTRGLPTFNLATTSLRHIGPWFDRLRDIQSGVTKSRVTKSHGNFFSDPASIGLVDNAARPRVLTPAGAAFLAKRPAVGTSEEKSEYELVKALYFSGHAHPAPVQQVLEQKRQYMIAVLQQFTPVPVRGLFLDHPSLLVIAELIGSFPGAIERLLNLSNQDLVDLAGLGEGPFSNLCVGPDFPPGLNRLCRRIASEYTRAQERRLYYVVSMALLTISQAIPPNVVVLLQVPAPFSNLLTELDIYRLHARYTSDISVWFNGVGFQATVSLTPPAAAPPIPLPGVSVQLLTGLPAGTGIAPSTHASRRQRRSARNTPTSIIVNPVISERAENIIEASLHPQFGASLIRVGHRSGETLALPDGMVPGADFYVVDGEQNPVEFVEVKSISGNPPSDINITRAEYLRAVRCVANGVPYKLFLVDVATGRFREVTGFAQAIAAAVLENVRQFVIPIS